MEVPFVLLLTRLVAEIAGKSTENSVPEAECCVEMLESNSSCPGNQHCSTGCYRSEDGSGGCVQCRNGSDCRDGSRAMNLSTATPFVHSLGGPAVALWLILGSLVLCLFLILLVASCFHLRRAHALRGACYGTASVLQPNETASMISPPVSSERRQRYARRERSQRLQQGRAMANSDCSV